MANSRLQFKKQYTAAGSPDATGYVSAGEIEQMTAEEFAMLDGRLVNVRRRKRRDIILFEDDVDIEPSMEKEIFRVGIGREDTYATSNNTFKKTRYHTNMSRNGDFGEKSLTIVKAIEFCFAATALQPTTVADGAPTNPKGAAISNYDPALFALTILQGLEIGFYRGETLIIDGQAIEFQQGNLLSGVAGAAVGAIFQNGGFGDVKQLENPQVLEDDEDFHVLVSPLHDIVNSNASGIGIPFGAFVKLHTTEVRRIY
jgi:hypothetical protein